MELAFPRAALDQSIAERFEQQVARHGGRIAVKTRRRELTYGALNGEVNRVAHAILARRRPPGEPVALFFEQGVAEIVSLLGILKAGHPYVALTPAHPPASLARMLEDSTTGLIVTNTETCPRLRACAPEGVDVLIVDELDVPLPADNPMAPLSPDALASIIYTSGSTGRPKGVMQTHRIFLHRAMEFTHDQGLGPDDRILMPIACTSSASVRLLFGALLNGAALYPFDVAAEGPHTLATWMADERITIYYSSPSVFRRFASALSGRADFPALRGARVASEALATADVELYRKRFPPHCVLGTSLASNETGTIARYVVGPDEVLSGATVPAGYPAVDKEILLVDETGTRVGAGEVGEIAVRSRYLSPGYWRRPDLTQAAFFPDPEGGDARVYRTGDLGRLRPDGCLEYLGRKDFRVKIRGQRVEVGDVETALIDLGAKEAVVVGREDGTGGQRLVAYMVPHEHPGPPISRLRRSLGERLPAHMIPATFVLLDALPLTPGGKVDRQALPSPESTRPDLDTPFAAPRTPVEAALAEIWAETLGLERVGIDDHFLDLGGDSLLATQVIARVTQRFAVDVPVRALFDAPTAAAMAVVVVRHLATLAGEEAMARLWRNVADARSAEDPT